VEPFTHGLASLALARAADKHLPHFGTLMVVASGLAADLDYASYFAGPSAFLRFHRTALHSLPGSVITASAIAGAFVAINRKLARERPENPEALLRFGPAFAACAIGVSGHLLLDLASGIGVQLLWPFRVRWYAWDLATNLDPWILVLLIAGLLLPQLFALVTEEIGARKKNTRGWRGAVITLLLLAAYFGARANLHSQAVDLLLSREYGGRVPLSAGAFPSASTPFNWRGVVVTDNTIEEVEVPVGPGAEFDPDRSLTRFKPEDSPALAAGEHAAATERFLKYARFPLAIVDRAEDAYRFQVRDLRFAHDDMSPANILVCVDLNSSLQVTRQEFRFASSSNP
jgi:inner membrane protein